MIKNLLVSIVLVVVYNLVFFQTGFSLGFSLFVISLNLGFYLFSSTSKNETSRTLVHGFLLRNRSLGLFSSVLASFFALMTVLRANELVIFIDVLLAAFFSLLSLYFYKTHKPFDFQIPTILKAPLETLTASSGAIFKLFDSKTYAGEQTDSKAYQALTKGILITVPVVGVLLFLLTQADPIFNKFTGKLFENSFERIFFSAVIFICSLCFSLIVFKDEVKEASESTLEYLSHKGYELSVMLGAVSLLFGGFIIIQFQYLFTTLTERQLADLGIQSLTYSEYVRKGFMELIGVSILVSFVLIYVLRFVPKLLGKQKLLVQLLSSTVIFETLVIILSAAQRVNLYQLEHGLTRARVFGLIFYAYLAIFLLILFVHLILHLKKKAFFSANITALLLAFLTVNFLNVDALIATVYKPTVNDRIDYFYISSLSPDAYQSWNEAVSHSEKVIKEVEGLDKSDPAIRMSTELHQEFYYSYETLRRIKNHLNQISTSDWREFNLTRNNALINAHENDLKKRVEQQIQRSEEFMRMPIYTRQPFVQLDRSTSPPLVR